MTWVNHAIWWHVYPLGFTGAPIWDADRTPTPRLRHLLNWLDYAVELGASGLLLGPIFDSRTHGYDTLDHFRIDPRLGDDQDFDDLVAACRERGLRIVLDGVFSHIAADHPAVQQALREGDRDSMFDIDWATPDQPHLRVFEGHGDLARLNHSHPQTRHYVQQVMSHWLARGVDGWRLDAAYSIDPDFWAHVLPDVRREHPEAWFLGEVIHGDYPGFVAASGVDSVTQYELWKAIWSSLKDANMFELDWCLQRHNDLLGHFTPQTFVGNHDVTRIATTLGPDRAILALGVLMSVGGIPSIYAGDEQGFTGLKEERHGGDDAIRPAFPDSPADLAPWGAATLRAHQNLIGLRRRHPWLTTARTETLELANNQYRYRSHSAAGEEFIDVAITLEPTPIITFRDGSGDLLWQFAPGQ